MVDWLTVGVSLGSSLAASYVGVRFFTGPRLRAERAVLTRVEIRDIVSPLRRDLRGFRAGMRRDLARDGAAHPDDAVVAVKLLRLSHDLPPMSRRSLRRRVGLVFGSGWTRVAELRDSTVADDERVTASHAMTISLFDRKRGSMRRSYVDGLLQRAYVAGPDSAEAKHLERQLALLSEGR
jgi:hypothetical protein